MKSLLVPVDFSAQSVHAFRFALEIAKKSRGIVRVLHVITLPALHESPMISVAALKNSLLVDLKETAEAKIASLIKAFNPGAVKIHTHVVAGPIQSSILRLIEMENIDLVVMGTKGASGVREWVVGSNTEKIVRMSPVPVIAVKNYAPGQTIRNIVFPNTLDTDNQEELVMKVKALQDFFHAAIHIIWVNTPALHYPYDEVRQRLDAFARRFMLKNYTINVFNYTTEEAGIVEFTQQLGADLIAMGTHGLRGMAHLIKGSLAEDIVNHVPYPVWTYCTRSVEKVTTQH